MTFRMASLVALVLALGVSACDTTAEADEPICLRGPIVAGDTVTGSLSASSCIHEDDVSDGYGWSSKPYESWSVHLEAGKAYLFHLKQVADPKQGGLNDVDAFLELHGGAEPGHPDLLTVSGNEANGVTGHDSEFWFVAPVSGDFTLIAASYYEDKLGGYQLVMNECPVLGVLDTVGVYEFTRSVSPCVRHWSDATVSTLNFVSVQAVGYEDLDLAVSHSTAEARGEFGGPGFDTYAHLNANSGYDEYWANGDGIHFQMGMYPGRMTLALSTDEFSAAGTYTIELGRYLPPASHRAP